MNVIRTSYTALLMVFILLVSSCRPVVEMPVPSTEDRAASFNSIEFVANIETMGVAVSGTSMPSTAELFYRRSGETEWKTGHALMRIDDGRLIGSLFHLAPATSYEIRVHSDSLEIQGVARTQPDELAFVPSSILHVDDNASPGGNGSAAAPFQTIQAAVNQAGPGTQVLVADGRYREAVTFPRSGMEGNWIQVKAAGNAAILDSADRLSGRIWSPYGTTPRVWFTRISGPVSYLARDGMRFYQYDDRSGFMRSRGHGGVTINEGWFYESSTSRLYVRSLDNPSSHTWQLPRLNHAFDIAARDWLWIEGFDVGFYGRCGVCTTNASHLVIRRNRIHNMHLGIFINWNGTEEQGNDTRIEENEVRDPGLYGLPWAGLKGSFMEGTGIIVRGHVGAIVRDNLIEGYFNGIYTGSSGALENSELAFDADIYGNSMVHISDDALEPEGACINHRFRDNKVDRSFIGVSIAPVTKGPTWVLNSVISNITSRAIKFADQSDGVVLIYHNTGWTNVNNVNGMDLITPVHNVVMRNNIFQSTGYSFAEVPIGSTGNDWNPNNWYTTRGTTGPHFKWENVNYNTIQALCAASRLECNGHESVPGFANPAGGDFNLLPTSPNIDRGILLPGINDSYSGSAPDLGAFELVTDFDPAVLSIVRVDQNPTGAISVDFRVTFSEPVRGVDLTTPFGDFMLTAGGEVQGAAITTVMPVSDSIFDVTVQTGSGNGTLQLDVIDDDSIVDAEGNPLGGAGPGNGTFNTGEVYTIDKTMTDLVSIAIKSSAAYDGWILESGEATNAGGTLDRGATTFNVGDDPRDRQYRGILSFNTSSLPENAVIVSVQLKIKRQSIGGTDPFGTHGALLLDIRNGLFSNNIALQSGDFSFPATPGSIRDSFAPLTFSWYAAQLSESNLSLVSKSGTTQFRLQFTQDDNDDQNADYMKFYSGNSTAANAPELIITYYVP